jgi:hypothetical protein
MWRAGGHIWAGGDVHPFVAPTIADFRILRPTNNSPDLWMMQTCQKCSAWIKNALCRADETRQPSVTWCFCVFLPWEHPLNANFVVLVICVIHERLLSRYGRLAIILVVRQPFSSSANDALLLLPEDRPWMHTKFVLGLYSVCLLHLSFESFGDFLMTKERCRQGLFDRFAYHPHLAFRCLGRMDAVLQRNM